MKANKRAAWESIREVLLALAIVVTAAAIGYIGYTQLRINHE